MKKKYIDLVRALIARREEKNIPISQMAEMCDKTRQQLYNFETFKQESYNLIFQYLHILFTREEIADIIEKWGL